MPENAPTILKDRQGGMETPRAPSATERMVKQRQRTAWQADCDSLLAAHPFTGALTRSLDPVPVIDSRLPTLMTDGHHLFANVHFIARLSAKMRRFLLAHAAYHCVGGHFLPTSKPDKHRWTLACEHTVNYLALLERIDIPAQAILYPAQAGKDIVSVYEWLAHHPCPSRDQPLDIHRPDLRLAGSRIAIIDPDFQPHTPDPTVARDWRDLAVTHACQSDMIDQEILTYLLAPVDR
ncbi:DUF2201 family putative metallopeptidase [Aidingimonas lacisalsi]|uniref:DUF2201 family putative metallopeptidase n=1 Tax=Aidingimonas lacisalsi TaxID=2604086 RepID=UPI0011D1CF3E|nr:hypothetical protein [Aidingimonas lacisalsi]